jgi:hypothetical protein
LLLTKARRGREIKISEEKELNKHLSFVDRRKNIT